jgi:hypothetical protein
VPSQLQAALKQLEALQIALAPQTESVHFADFKAPAGRKEEYAAIHSFIGFSFSSPFLFFQGLFLSLGFLEKCVEKKQGDCLYICGRPGTGKTFTISKAVASCAQGIFFFFVSCSTFSGGLSSLLLLNLKTVPFFRFSALASSPSERHGRRSQRSIWANVQFVQQKPRTQRCAVFLSVSHSPTPTLTLKPSFMPGQSLTEALRQVLHNRSSQMLFVICFFFAHSPLVHMHTFASSVSTGFLSLTKWMPWFRPNLNRPSQQYVLSSCFLLYLSIYLSLSLSLSLHLTWHCPCLVFLSYFQVLQLFEWPKAKNSRLILIGIANEMNWPEETFQRTSFRLIF